MKKSVFLFVFIGFLSCNKKPKVAENKIKEDVAYLADDKLEGRQTGTQGEILAAEYLVKRFTSIGLQSNGTEGYLQPFSFRPKTDPHSEVEFTTNTDSTITGQKQRLSLARITTI
jgi:hypothetical protein